MAKPEDRYVWRERIWYWWHMRVCHPLHYVHGPHGLMFRQTGWLLWLYKRQLNWVCAPLDDWAHGVSRG